MVLSIRKSSNFMAENTPEGTPNSSSAPEAAPAASERSVYLSAYKATSLDRTNADSVLSDIKLERATNQAKELLKDIHRPKGIRSLLKNLFNQKARAQELRQKISEIYHGYGDELISTEEVSFVQGIFEASADDINRQMVTAMLDNRPRLEKFIKSEKIQRILDTTIVAGISVGAAIGMVSKGSAFVARTEARQIAEMLLNSGVGSGAIIGGALGGYRSYLRSTRNEYRAFGSGLQKDLEGIREKGTAANQYAALLGLKKFIKAKVSAGNVAEAIQWQYQIEKEVTRIRNEMKLNIEDTLQEISPTGKLLERYHASEPIAIHHELNEKAQRIYERIKGEKTRKIVRATVTGAVGGALLGGIIGATAEIIHHAHSAAEDKIANKISEADLLAAKQEVTEGFYNIQPDPATHIPEALNVRPEVIAQQKWDLFTKESGRIQTRIADLLNQDHPLKPGISEIHSARDVLHETHQLHNYLAAHPLEANASPRDIQDASELARKLGMMETAAKSEIKPAWWNAYAENWNAVVGTLAGVVGASALAAYLRHRGGKLSRIVPPTEPAKLAVPPIKQPAAFQETGKPKTEKSRIEQIVNQLQRLQEIYDTPAPNKLPWEEQLKQNKEIDQIFTWFKNELGGDDMAEKAETLHQAISQTRGEELADFFRKSVVEQLCKSTPEPTAEQAPEPVAEPAPELAPAPEPTPAQEELPGQPRCLEVITSPEWNIESMACSIPSIGKRMKHSEPNQDALLYQPGQGLFGVFDGLGGHDHAHEASARASQLVEAHLTVTGASGYQSVAEIKHCIEQALMSASEAIRAKGIDEKDKKPRSTTASVVQLWSPPNSTEVHAIIGHVGDSRVYIWRSQEQKLESITLDDGPCKVKTEERNGQIGFISRFVPDTEAKLMQNKLSNVATYDDLSQLSRIERKIWDNRYAMTQAVGDESISPQLYDVPISEDDIVIITSDGVHDNLTDNDMQRVINEHQASDSVTLNIYDRLRRKTLNASTSRTGSCRNKDDDISLIIIRHPKNTATDSTIIRSVEALEPPLPPAEIAPLTPLIASLWKIEFTSLYYREKLGAWQDTIKELLKHVLLSDPDDMTHYALDQTKLESLKQSLQHTPNGALYWFYVDTVEPTLKAEEQDANRPPLSPAARSMLQQLGPLDATNPPTPEPAAQLTEEELRTAQNAFNHIDILYELFTKTNLDPAETAGYDRRMEELRKLLAQSSRKTELLKEVGRLVARSRDPRMAEFVEKQIEPRL
jgi:protein phosphatase